jgi:hypothetical protein
VVAVCANVVALIYFGYATFRLQTETESLEHAPEHSHAIDSTSARVALLEKENERLRSDLAMLPELQARKNALEQGLRH